MLGEASRVVPSVTISLDLSATLTQSEWTWDQGFLLAEDLQIIIRAL